MYFLKSVTDVIRLLFFRKHFIYLPEVNNIVNSDDRILDVIGVFQRDGELNICRVHILRQIKSIIKYSQELP